MAKRRKNRPRSIKAIVALCEGKTDLAFLRKVLAADDYRDYKEIVANMPLPLGLGGKTIGSYFVEKLKSHNYDSSRLMDRPILPLIMRRTQGQSNVFLLLYDMNGMARRENYNEIITDFKKLADKSQENDFESDDPSIDAAMALIFDLDKNNVSQQLAVVKETYGQYLNELNYLTAERLFTNSPEFKAIGCHFLGAENAEGGNLEEIILPLMRRGKEGLFAKAKEVLNCDGGFARYKNTALSEKDENKTASDFNKSLIGVVGQLEHSGVGNAEIIKNSSLLNSDKFKNSSQCKDIIAFFKALREKL